MALDVTIPARVCGPPNSANGGWAASVVASHVATSLTERAVEVTLRRPPPLDTPLSLGDGADPGDEHGARSAVLVDGDETLVAEARRASLVLPVLPPPSSDQLDAAPVIDGWDPEHHAFAGCFVCGPARQPGDGMRLFPHRIAEGLSPRFATRWTPPADLLEADGTVGPALLWSALDCPSAFPFLVDAAGKPPVVLGRMTAEICDTARADDPDEPLVVSSWQAGPDDGRKHLGASAVFAGPRLIARALATWIDLPPAST